MLSLLKTELNKTQTENGAITPESTGSDCLDFFATAGAIRQESDAEITKRFLRAYSENPDMAMRLLFYTRDIRGGLGERRVFRVILHWLANNRADSVLKNLAFVAEFGRYDDLFCLFDTKCEKAMLALVKTQLGEDLKALEQEGEVSLLGKWLPSVNASDAETIRQGKAIAKSLGMTDAQYRKTLVALRSRIRIIENNLREKDYNIHYESQPSRALLKYRKAFIRNDGKHYHAFLNAVMSGKTSMHTACVSPYELVNRYLASNGNCHMDVLSEEEKLSLNTTWNAFPDFGEQENALAVIDTSASMYYSAAAPKPAAVALSLGLYFAERNKGLFGNHFIEFSKRPQLIELKGETFTEKLQYACTFNRVANTNLEAVFNLILDTAVKNGLPQNELPAKLIVISDMEFDSCMENASLSNFENAKNCFARQGYKLPEVVFWNVASRNRQQPVKLNEQGVILVSGVSPRLFEMVAGNHLSPYAFMLEILEDSRYAMISA